MRSTSLALSFTIVEGNALWIRGEAVMLMAMKAILKHSALVVWLSLATPADAGTEAIPLTNTPPALHNVFRMTASVLSGSQPEGDASYAWLAAQGVKTIISVDGARPDVDTARRHGLRYVHLPIGYDGLSTNRMLELAKVGASVRGPFYVHCHHGKHRGPAAAAVLCEASQGWSPTEAEAYLKKAGTSMDYPGLHRSVASFQKPDAAALEALPGTFPEAAATPSLVQAMVSLDILMERLRVSQKAGWKTPPSHPDLSPAHEAVQLWEQFRELGRLGERKEKSSSYADLLRASETAANDLRQGLTTPIPPGDAQQTQVDAAFRRVSETCSACHRKHRN